MAKKIMNFIDLFCGAGGLSCGMEMAGWRCLLGVDKDSHAIDTFNQNHQYANSFSGNIEELTSSELSRLTGKKEIHAVVGGPPCQGFSTVGKGDPKDDRNKLFLEFVRVVKETKPLFVVIENVTGLLAKKNEATIKEIFRIFRRMGYNLDVQVVSAHHYGVAEKRRRTIILGTKINNKPIFPTISYDIEVKGKYITPNTVGDVFKEIENSRKKVFNHDIESAKIKDSLDIRRLKRIPEGGGIRYEKDEKNYFTPSLSLGVNWKEIPESRFRQTKYFRLNRSLPSPTIMTHRHSYYHPTEHRYLTQREAASIQSFPIDFIFKGSLSAQWRQIGNAVPPLLGKAIGNALNDMYKKSKKEKLTSKTKAAPSILDVRKKAFVYKR